MPKTPQHLQNPENSISVSELALRAPDWILDSKIRSLSPTTIEGRRLFVEKLLWFLRNHDFDVCGLDELRRFFVYLADAHNSETGRWGNPRLRAPLRPITIRTFHTQCRVLFNWLVDEGVIDESPLKRIKAPRALADQIRPFNSEQIEAILNAARRSRHPRRDEAIILLLLDTGLRASELVGLHLRDVDINTRSCTVTGKGNKRRTVYFGRPTAKALYQYLRQQPREADAPLFTADRGTRAGEALTRYGLLQLIERLGKKAGIEAMQCSPHVFRHTFSLCFLQAGGNVFSLQQLLGHTSLQMTNRYVALAQGDLQEQHRQFAPSDRLKQKKKG